MAGKTFVKGKSKVIIGMSDLNPRHKAVNTGPTNGAFIPPDKIFKITPAPINICGSGVGVLHKESPSLGRKCTMPSESS